MAIPFTVAPIAPLQALVAGEGHGSNQLFGVGAALYYVTGNQVSDPVNQFFQVYKTTNFTTWSLVAQSQPAGVVTSDVDVPCVQVGAILYILANQLIAAHPLQLVPFDASTNLFSALSSVGPNSLGLNECTVGAFNNGKLFAVYQVQAGNSLNAVVYDPGSDTWSGATVLVADTSSVLNFAHDPVSDLVFCFYRKAATREIRCSTFKLVAGVLTVQSDVTVITGNAFGPFPRGVWGIPIVGASEVLIPVRQVIGGNFELLSARSPIQAAPVFSTDTVEDLTTLPANSQVQGWDQIAGPFSLAASIGGLLYAFYIIDNGELDNAASRAWIYYRSSTGPGVWSGPTIAMTPGVSAELMTPYLTSVAGNTALLVNTINPSLWPALNSLTSFIAFTGSLVTQAPSVLVRGPMILPDPRNICRKRMLPCLGRTMKRRHCGRPR